MRVPEALVPLFDEGVIDEVVRPLMAGKEAQIYLVRSDGYAAVAKVYKEADRRSFKNRADYTEGRRVRNSRQQRAIEKGSRFGREQIEDAWRSAEVDAIYRLRAAGVRVPEPYTFIDGVLVMELVCDEQGEPAPRLADVTLTEEAARAMFHALVRDVCRMLCAGVVHGDLSDFNVLIGADGPVIIDFPQACDPAQNRNARKLLIRDVDNLTSFLARFAPDLKRTRYGAEMWDLYERGQLLPDTPLTGKFKQDDRRSNVSALLREIDDISREVAQRREALGLPMRPARAPKVREEAPEPAPPRREERRPQQQERRPQQDDRRPQQDDRRRPQEDRRPQHDDRRPHDDRRRPQEDRRPAFEDRRPAFEDRRPAFEDRPPQERRRPQEDRRPAFEDRPPQEDRRRPQEDRRPAFEDRRPAFEERRPPQQDRRTPQGERRSQEERRPEPTSERRPHQDHRAEPGGRRPPERRPPEDPFDDLDALLSPEPRRR